MNYYFIEYLVKGNRLEDIHTIHDKNEAYKFYKDLCLKDNIVSVSLYEIEYECYPSSSYEETGDIEFNIVNKDLLCKYVKE